MAGGATGVFVRAAGGTRESGTEVSGVVCAAGPPLAGVAEVAEGAASSSSAPSGFASQAHRAPTGSVWYRAGGIVY